MDRPLEKGLPKRTKAELLAALRNDFARIPGLVVQIGQPISHRIDHMLSGTRAAIAIKLFGPESDPASLTRLRQLAKLVKQEIEGIPGVVDPSVEQQADVPIMKVAYDRQAIQRHGLRVGQVGHEIERAFAGEIVSQVLEGRNAFDMVVRTSEEGKFDETDINRLPISTANGTKVPLGALAKVQRDGGPNTVSRENVQRKIVVSCNVAGRDVGSVVADIQKRSPSVPLGSPQRLLRST
jgi:Cu/Ag efflux pump CusA